MVGKAGLMEFRIVKTQLIVTRYEWFLTPFISVYDNYSSATTKRDWVVCLGWLKWTLEISRG